MTPSTPTWPSLLARIEGMYGSGREPWPDAVSDFNNGQPVRIFDDEVFAELGPWLVDAWLLAESAGPATIARELWNATLAYTGRKLSELGELDLGAFEFPLANRTWNPRDETDVEDYYVRIDIQAVGHLFMQEMVALARLAARAAPKDDATPGQSDLVTPEHVAMIEGITPERKRQQISEYKTKHGRLPTWAFMPPGKKRGVLIRWSVYTRQASPRT